MTKWGDISITIQIDPEIARRSEATRKLLAAMLADITPEQRTVIGGEMRIAAKGVSLLRDFNAITDAQMKALMYRGKHGDQRSGD